MRLLLDTHTLLWAMEDSPKLPARLRPLLKSPDNDVLVSIASLWEMAIKQGLGRMRLDLDVERTLAEDNFALLPIELRHLTLVRTLPLHHRDPFDRMLVAQALCDGLTLVTTDEDCRRYGAQTLW